MLTSGTEAGSGFEWQAALKVRPDRADGLLFEVTTPYGTACLALRAEHVRELRATLERWLVAREGGQDDRRA